MWERNLNYWTTRENIGQRREIMERDGKYRKVMGIIGQRDKILYRDGKYGTEWEYYRTAKEIIG